jgi:hypothetical protein
MLITNVRWSLLLLLFTIPFVSCDKEEEPEAFIDRIEGQYTGDFEQLTCSLPQSEIFTVEGNATADLVKLTDEDIQVTLGAPGLGAFFQFEGTMSSDTSFAVPPFTDDDGTVYVGNVIFAEDQLRVALSDSCIIFGSLATTVFFREL